MRRDRQVGSAGQLFLDRFHDVMRSERLPIVFANMAVSAKAGFGAEIAGKLAGIIILDNDDALAG